MHWKTLQRQFRRLEGIPKDWKSNEYALFFEIEMLLYLYECLVPRRDARDAALAWGLASGYFVPQLIEHDPAARQKLLNTRQRIRYVRTISAWRFWLRWYRSQPADIRLYDISEDNRFEQRSGVPFRHQRLEAYRAIFDLDEVTTAYAKPNRTASSGMYSFEIDDEMYQVTIPELPPKVEAQDTLSPPVQARQSPEPIELDLNALMESAKELDTREAKLDFVEPHNWQKRLEHLHFHIPCDDNDIRATKALSVNGLLHLVGALGVGKSTLIWLLVYHLAAREQRHVSIIMNTVVEAFQFARWLRLMDVTAAPALGKNRVEHARKAGFAHPDVFDPQRVFANADPDEPLFRWLPKPCMLSGAAGAHIPMGKEPCYRLYDENGEKHHCPLLDDCPVHQITRDLATSQVWVLNPASFLYSRAPKTRSTPASRLFEAIYQRSDLLIIDEADRVQANWDTATAPTALVLGSDKALLDWLHRQLGVLTSGFNRSAATRSTVNRLTKMDDQTNMLANRVYYLLNVGQKQHLLRWLEHRQLTNRALFGRLTKELAKAFPRSMNHTEQSDRIGELQQAFQAYWHNPLRRESGFLAEWLNDVLGGDKSEAQLRVLLDNWLAQQMGWPSLSEGKRRQLCRKLDVAITITALIKRINDINRQLPWVQDLLAGNVPEGAVPLPRELLDALPEPPLGRILGIRVVTDPLISGQRYFYAMRYNGVGRWLLLNYHRLYADQTGQYGPQVLLTSATSWLPGAPTFHIAKTPQATMVKDDNEAKPHSSKVQLRFKPVQYDEHQVRVSGSSNKEADLRRIVRALAVGKAGNPSDLERELQYWQRTGVSRRVLLVVHSYEQAEWVVDEMQQIPRWNGHVLRLFPDASDQTQAGIRTREVETFHAYDAEVLIAPLMAIQRGFNILDERGEALLGTTFFLVRPVPPPDDLTAQIMSLNAWFMYQLADERGRWVAGPGDDTVKALDDLRRAANRQWLRRLRGTAGIASMDDDLYEEFLRDSFIIVWQTVGRMLRSGSSARVFFVDAAFGSGHGKRHMLRDWHAMLESLFEADNAFDNHLAHALYGEAWLAFQKAYKERRL